MEKIKLKNIEYEVVSIGQRGSNLLEIVFPQPVTLAGKNLSRIELYTAGGILCATIEGFTTILSGDGTTHIVLSKGGSTPPVVVTPIESDPPEEGAAEEPGPSEIDLRLQEIYIELGNLSNAIVLMTLM